MVTKTYRDVFGESQSLGCKYWPLILARISSNQTTKKLHCTCCACWRTISGLFLSTATTGGQLIRLTQLLDQVSIIGSHGLKKKNLYSPLQSKVRVFSGKNQSFQPYFYIFSVFSYSTIYVWTVRRNYWVCIPPGQRVSQSQADGSQATTRIDLLTTCRRGVKPI